MYCASSPNVNKIHQDFFLSGKGLKAKWRNKWTEIIRQLCEKKSLRLVLPCSTCYEKILKILYGYSRLRLANEETDNEMD